MRTHKKPPKDSYLYLKKRPKILDKVLGLFKKTQTFWRSSVKEQEL